MFSLCVGVLDNSPPEQLRGSSETRFVSQLNVTVTDDAEYVCQWSTAAGAADNLTSVVSVITGNTPVLPVQVHTAYVHDFRIRHCYRWSRMLLIPSWTAPGFLLCMWGQRGGKAKGIGEGRKTGHVLRASSYTWGPVGSWEGPRVQEVRSAARCLPPLAAPFHHDWITAKPRLASLPVYALSLIHI